VRIWLLVLALLAAAFVALTARLFAFPAEDAPERADVVVVLAGNSDLRIPAGRRLVREGVAPRLVLSEEDNRDFPRVLCRRADVTCFQADPFSTTGEAATFGELARRRGWRRVVVVTSDYHLTRARLLFERCVGGDVDAVAADEDVLSWLHGTAWEWPKLLHALTVKRDC
jgi:uncharacterized SAM-binding protein YcdF (DUF218 family)